jgi:hypothetical protein
MSQSLPPMEYQSFPPDSAHRGWRSGLLVFGIITIVLGGLSGCLGAFMPVTLVIPQPTGMPRGARQVSTVISAALTYVLLAATLIWIGIGSIRAQRWVRPVVLATATMTLISGIFMLVFGAILAPSMMKATPVPGTPAPPPGVVFGTFVVMGLFFFVLLVLLPAAYIWFYRKPAVRDALHFYDVVPRWTDDIPIPVLGVSLALLTLGVMTLLSTLYGVTAQLGTVLHGPTAIAVLAVEGLAALYLSYAVLMRTPASWWATLGLIMLWFIAFGMTAIRTDKYELYRSAGFTEQELSMIRASGVLDSSRAWVGMLPALLLCVGYLLYVRKRYFYSR